MSAAERRVKGILFADYVRMLRVHKDVDWSGRLQPVDLGFLARRIEPGEWCPMETFERMGLAILDEVVHGDLEMVRTFGRASIDWLCESTPNLLAPGDPRDSLMRFQVLRRSFFDYPALEIQSISDGEASVQVAYAMGPRAEEAASWQTLGFFERLLEVAGARDVTAWFSSKAWTGEPATVAQLRWKA